MLARVVAADSMGVRSIATFVEACGYSIGIDLGASIAPRRYSLPPHEVELRRLEEALDSSRRLVSESDIIVITHYHYDHYLRDEPDLYAGKVILAKDISREINFSQRMRGYRFLVKSGLRERARVEYADGRSFSFGRLRIELSSPVWHGEPGTKLGKVLMVRVLCEDEALVFASDVQGPIDPAVLGILREWSTPRPKMLIMDGPPSYFAGYKVSVEAVERGFSNMLDLIRSVRPETLVVDHHLLRDLKYREKIEAHVEAARDSGVRLLTAAELMGRPVEPLEALRKELWRGQG